MLQTPNSSALRKRATITALSSCRVPRAMKKTELITIPRAAARRRSPTGGAASASTSGALSAAPPTPAASAGSPTGPTEASDGSGTSGRCGRRRLIPGSGALGLALDRALDLLVEGALAEAHGGLEAALDQALAQAGVPGELADRSREPLGVRGLEEEAVGASLRYSPEPPRPVAITGRPTDIASSGTSPHGSSQRTGKTIASASS